MDRANALVKILGKELTINNNNTDFFQRFFTGKFELF